MVLKKKKSSEDSEETKSGIKLGKVSIKKAKQKKKDDEERKAGKSEATYVKFPQAPARTILWIIPPTSEDMKGYPTVDKLTHNNLGPEKKGWGPCMRTDMSKETRGDCDACVIVGKLWDKSREMKKAGKPGLEEKYKKEAMDAGVRSKPLAQVLDVTGVYNKAGEIARKFPTCFGENYKSDSQKYEKCEECAFSNSCTLGIQKWEMQFGASEKLTDKLGEDEIDVTDPANAIPIRIIRKGEGRTKTRYTEEWMKPIVIPPHVIKFVEKHAVDLSKAVKPSTKEQMAAMLSGGEGKKTEVTGDSTKKKSSKVKNVEKPTVTDEQREKLRARLKADSAKKKKK
jgi:hypothetical protein